MDSSVAIKPPMEGFQKRAGGAERPRTSVAGHVSAPASQSPWCKGLSERPCVSVHPPALPALEKEGSGGSGQMYKVTLWPGAASVDCLSG